MSTAGEQRWHQRARAKATGTVETWVRSTARAFAHAGPERNTALMLLKAAIATVIAWQVALRLLHSPQPFYAPLAALLVVDETMVRSLWASAQRLAAVVLGMVVAWAVGSLVGVNWLTMVPVLLLALFIGRWRRLGDHGIQVPIMTLLSLLTVHGTDTKFTYLTLVETVAGALVGVATNAVVLAPLHVQQPRDAVKGLTARVRRLLDDMATGLREGWDADTARQWYDTSTEIVRTAPEVLEAIATGRESTRLNPRHDLRPVAVDWAGYERTVETVRRSQWQVSGIARTLVDAVDGSESLPVPSKRFLDGYASALADIGRAVGHFGLRDEQEQAEVEQHLDRARATLDELGEWVRSTPLDDPHAWPAHGALLLDARRLAAELSARKDEATVPTDSGPIRMPLQDRLKEIGLGE